MARKITIGFTGKGYSEIVPPGCDPDRVSLLAVIGTGSEQYYLWKPLPDAAFSDSGLMEGLKESLHEHALTCDLRHL